MDAPSGERGFCQQCQPGEGAPRIFAHASSSSSGRFSTGNFTLCTDCAKGEHQTLPGQSSCTLCEPGRFASVTGAGLQICNELLGISSSPSAGLVECKDCEPGTVYSVDGAIVCDNCQSGSFQSESGKTQCESCVFGKYTGSERQVVCGENSCVCSHLSSNSFLEYSGLSDWNSNSLQWQLRMSALLARFCPASARFLVMQPLRHRVLLCC
jgi:hypothetical protein